jgi:hypothetical protein
MHELTQDEPEKAPGNHEQGSPGSEISTVLVSPYADLNRSGNLTNTPIKCLNESFRRPSSSQ